MSVFVDYDTAWEDINLVLMEIERKATEAKKRTDILFYIYGTLEQSRHVIHMGIDSTAGINAAREGQNTSNWDGDMIELIGMFDGSETNDEEPWKNSPADVARKYLQECFGCSFRMAFDWQLNPLSLLQPLLDTVRGIMAAIKPLLDALDPMKQLERLCAFMDQLKIFCPQDLASLIMALKSLLFSYALRGFNIKLDWTMILGPLLKAIAGLLIAIIDAILNLVLAPIDCLLGALRAAEQVERAGRDLAAGTAQFAQQTAASFQSINGARANTTKRNVQTVPGAKGSEVMSPHQNGLGKAQGQSVPGGDEKKGIPSGFEIKQAEPLDMAYKRPEWANATILQKAVVSVSTARQHLVNLFDNLKITLDSLSQLVGGGLILSLEIGGLLLMIFDMIGMIMMIIRMFMAVGNPRDIDWCKYLAENPDELREQLRKFYKVSDVGLISTEGTPRNPINGLTNLETPEVVSYSVVVNGKSLGDIPLCISTRDSQTQAFLDSWIKELEQSS